MNDINLLPPNYLQKMKLIRYIKKMAAIQAALFLCFVLFVYIIFSTNSFIDRISLHYDVLLKDPSYDQGDLVAATLRAKRAEWDQRSRILETLELDSNVPITHETIRALTNSLPAQMHIRSIKAGSETGIDIQAIATQKKMVSVYLESLDGYFQNCSLTALATDEDGVHVSIHIEQLDQ